MVGTALFFHPIYGVESGVRQLKPYRAQSSGSCYRRANLLFEL